MQIFQDRMHLFSKFHGNISLIEAKTKNKTTHRSLSKKKCWNHLWMLKGRSGYTIMISSSAAAEARALVWKTARCRISLIFRLKMSLVPLFPPFKPSENNDDNRLVMYQWLPEDKYCLRLSLHATWPFTRPTLLHFLSLQIRRSNWFYVIPEGHWSSKVVKRSVGICFFAIQVL